MLTFVPFGLGFSIQGTSLMFIILLSSLARNWWHEKPVKRCFLLLVLHVLVLCLSFPPVPGVGLVALETCLTRGLKRQFLVSRFVRGSTTGEGGF